MKVVLVCFIVLIAAATAFAYGQSTVATDVTAVVSTSVITVFADTWTEPLALLLSGSALLGIAGAVRRMPF